MDQKQRIPKACDACRLRKVKCNGEQRCPQCSHLGLRCTYSSASSKQRTQGKRGRLISEYKKNTATSQQGPPTLVPRLGVGEQPAYDATFFLSLLPAYMASVYPPQPIITENEIRELVQAMDTNLEARTLVFAFGAVTLNLTCTGQRRTEEITSTITTLMNNAIQFRGPIRPNLRPSVFMAMTSLFFHNCLMTLRDVDTAFYYMRDAISLIQLLPITSSLNPTERARRQRLYWQAYIHERFLAILDYRQAILPPLPAFPEDDPTIPPHVQEGFNQIIKLFQLLDTEFLQNWLGSSQDNSAITPSWIETKSKELEQRINPSALEQSKLTVMQRADLIVTQQWLRTLVWRLAMSKTLLSSQSSKECLSLLLPVRLSKEVRQQVTDISRDAIEIHGSGIVQKLFEITDTIADVLIHIPAATIEETALRVDDFIFLLNYLFGFPTLDQTRRGILSEKLQTLQNMFPQECNTPGSSHSIPSPALRNRQVGDTWYHITRSMISQVGSPMTEDGSERQAQLNEIAHRLSATGQAHL